MEPDRVSGVRSRAERAAFLAGVQFAYLNMICGPKYPPNYLFGRPFNLSVEWPVSKPNPSELLDAYKKLREGAVMYGYLPLGPSGPASPTVGASPTKD